MLDFDNLLTKNSENKLFTDFEKNFDITNGIEKNEKKILLEIILEIKKNNVELDKIFKENKDLSNEEKLKIKDKLIDNKEFIKKLVGEANLEKVSSKTSIYIPPKNIDSLLKNILGEDVFNENLTIKQLDKNNYKEMKQNEEEDLKFFISKVNEISKIIQDISAEKHYSINKNNDITGIMNTVKSTIQEFIEKDDIYKKLNKNNDISQKIMNNIDMYDLMNKLHKIHYEEKNKKIDLELNQTLKYG